MEEKKEQVEQTETVNTQPEEVKPEDTNSNNTEAKPEEKQPEVQAPTALDAQVIGELEKEKQKGVFGLIVFFAILLGVTFGLPSIKEYIDNRNAPTQNSSMTSSNEVSSTENVPAEEELVYYEINPKGADIPFNDFKIKSLNKESSDDFYLTFSILNEGKSNADLNDGYFIDLYTSEKTLLERVKLVGEKVILSNETLDIKLPISENSYTNANLITISKKTAEDYPEVTLNNVENDLNVLACTNEGRNIKYYFKDDKLLKISDIYEYTNEDATLYNDTLKEYTSEAASLNNNTGVSSNIVDTTTAFTMNTQIDLEKANVKNLNSHYYYAKDTNSKTIKFEMEAMRFTCN